MRIFVIIIQNYNEIRKRKYLSVTNDSFVTVINDVINYLCTEKQ